MRAAEHIASKFDSLGTADKEWLAEQITALVRAARNECKHVVVYLSGAERSACVQVDPDIPEDHRTVITEAILQALLKERDIVNRLRDEAEFHARVRYEAAREFGPRYTYIEDRVRRG